MNTITRNNDGSVTIDGKTYYPGARLTAAQGSLIATPSHPAFQHESTPPRKRIIKPGEWCLLEDGTPCRMDPNLVVVEEWWPVYPAMPRPADPPGYRVTEWEDCRGPGCTPYLSHDGQEVCKCNGIQAAEWHFGGWRWRLEKLPEVRRWTKTLHFSCGDIDVPFISDYYHSVRLDTATIAREAVIAELEKMLAYPLNWKANAMARIAELRAEVKP